ncbi:MAG: hypothetical protein U0235_11155 [Polyangiaceae bacterium]
MALAFGERGDRHGYLVGEPHRGRAASGTANEARIMVGGMAYTVPWCSTSPCWRECAVRAARDAAKDPTTPQLPIIRYFNALPLLRQKAIV